MANIPTLEAAPEDDGAPPVKPAGKSWLTFAIIILVVLGGGGAAAWYFLTGNDRPTAEKQAEKPHGPPLYVGLDPPFVVNFQAEQLVRFLQITVQIMSRDAEVIEQIKSNDPAIRNDLLLLFGNQSYTVISTREGKEKLREEALKTVRNIVKSAGGKPEAVEQVYFTSFVMQ